MPVPVPVAGCHVLPLSVETSTPATRPPTSGSVVPAIVIVWFSGRFALLVGFVIVEPVGGVRIGRLGGGHQARLK